MLFIIELTLKKFVIFRTYCVKYFTKACFLFSLTEKAPLADPL